MKLGAIKLVALSLYLLAGNASAKLFSGELYMGTDIGLGSTSYKGTTDSLSETLTKDDGSSESFSYDANVGYDESSTNYGLYAGLDLNKYLAFEVGYRHFKTKGEGYLGYKIVSSTATTHYLYDISQNDTTAHQLRFVPILKMPISKFVLMKYKLGLATTYYSTDYSFNLRTNDISSPGAPWVYVENQTKSANSLDFGLYAGLEASVFLTKNISTSLFIDTTNDGTAQNTVAGINLTWYTNTKLKF